MKNIKITNNVLEIKQGNTKYDKADLVDIGQKSNKQCSSINRTVSILDCLKKEAKILHKYNLVTPFSFISRSFKLLLINIQYTKIVSNKYIFR